MPWTGGSPILGCLGPVQRAKQGIASGSAFATTELVLLLCRCLQKVELQYNSFRWCIHVDDLSVTVFASTREEAVKKAKEAYLLMKSGFVEPCKMLMAPDKTTVVATCARTAAAVAHEIGQAAEVGFCCKKLGVDVSLELSTFTEWQAVNKSRAGWRPGLAEAESGSPSPKG